jgi:hypothetical protein
MIMDKAGLSFATVVAAFLLSTVSPAPCADSTARPNPAPAGPLQMDQAEADLARWEKQLTLPPHVAARLDWASGAFVPSGYRKLESLARAKAPAIAAGQAFAALEKETARDRLFSASGISGPDASEAAFLVLAMAAKDMDDDLRMIMAEIKAMNAAKQKLRDQIRELDKWISEEMGKAKDSAKRPAAASRAPSAKARPVRIVPLQKASSPVIRLEYVRAPTIPPLPPRNADIAVSGLKSLLDELEGRLDDMNELSEMTSLRLQMTMDRRSKFISTLSQMMKKTSTTQDVLVQNIK